MKKYAMTILNRVIGLEQGDTAPLWGADPEGNPVVPIEYTTETVELGMIYDNGEFVWPTPEPPTNEELRKAAYETMTHKEDGTPLIPFYGVDYTCDEAYAMLAVYSEEDKYAGTVKASELGASWVLGKEYIRAKYPTE